MNTVKNNLTENALLDHTAYAENATGGFDVAKFVLSVLVVAIHTYLYPDFLYPWLRLAVPLFFMISAYFLFGKIRKCTDEHARLAAMKKFTLRNLALYLFWFLVLLPFTLKMRASAWQSDSFLKSYFYLCRSFFFDSTFLASWFIMASVLGMWVVYFVAKKLGNKTLFCITLCIHVLVCLRSSYFPLLSEHEWIVNASKLYEKFFSLPQFNLTVALFWIVSGKCFADGTFTFRFKTVYLWIGLVVSAALLYVEWLLVRKWTEKYNNDCYLFLAPVCIAVFALLTKTNLSASKWTVILRKTSTIVYALHASLAYLVITPFCRTLPNPPDCLSFLITLGICLAVSATVLFLEKFRLLRWLKYAH